MSSRRKSPSTRVAAVDAPANNVPILERRSNGGYEARIERRDFNPTRRNAGYYVSMVSTRRLRLKNSRAPIISALIISSAAGDSRPLRTKRADSRESGASIIPRITGRGRTFQDKSVAFPLSSRVYWRLRQVRAVGHPRLVCYPGSNGVRLSLGRLRAADLIEVGRSADGEREPIAHSAREFTRR